MWDQIVAKHTFKFAITKIWEEIPTSMKTLSQYQSKNNDTGEFCLTLKGNDLKRLTVNCVTLHSCHAYHQS